MKYSSESFIDYIKGCATEPTVRMVADAFNVVDPIEYRRLKDRLHGMVKCGILGVTKTPGVQRVTFHFIREKLPVVNPAGLSKAERKRLNSERYNRKIGMMPRKKKLEVGYKVNAAPAQRVSRLTIKSPTVVTTPVEFESVEAWIKRTGQTPEILPGLKMI